MIDTHCHIDLYKNPIKILQECENAGITVLAMTNLPSHFEMGYPHILPFKRIRLALGMHPLHAEQHDQEFSLFLKNLSKTSYIGEVGLDFSREGYTTKEIQVNSFERILNQVTNEKKILSLHSRKAEKEILSLLIEKNIKSAIFHWYSGPLSLVDKIVEAGYYFSVNPTMVKSDSGRKIINRIPSANLLTETDGPFIEVDGRQVKPTDAILVYQHCSRIWGKTIKEADLIISTNFQRLLSHIQ